MVDIFSHGRMPILAVSRLHLIDPSSIEHKCLLDSLSKLHLTDNNRSGLSTGRLLYISNITVTNHGNKNANEVRNDK